LRVLQSVFDGDWELYRHFRQYLLIAAAWAGVSTAFSFLSSYVFYFMGSSSFSSAPSVNKTALWLYLPASWAVWLLAMAAVAGVCHRSVILGEPPSVPAAFRFDRAFWRFMGTVILIALAALALLYVGIIFLANALPADAILGLPFQWLAYPTAFALASPFVLALPIASAGGRPRPIKAAIALGRGHRLRLWGILLLVASPIPLFAAGLEWFLTHLYDWLPDFPGVAWVVWLLLSLLSQSFMNLGVVALAGALSSAYLQLAGAAPNRDIASVFD
jgi:hypothetical protein